MARRLPLITLAVSVGLSVVELHAVDIELRPVSADGTHSIVGNEILLTGAGQRVFLEIFVANWDPDLDGNPELRAIQVTIDSSGYSSGIGAAIGPALEPCTGSTECQAAFDPGSTCYQTCDGGDRAGERCTANSQCPPASTCVLSFCEAGFQDTSRSDWLYATLFSAFPGVDTTSPDFRYAGTATGSVVDPGVPAYFGTLVLDVPTGAAGTYPIGFIEGPNDTFVIDANDNAITPVNVTEASITVECVTNTDCDDGNVCTTDACNPDGTCTNANNFDDTEFCCNPDNGDLTVLSDGNDCTQDVCNADGTVSHPPEPEFTACGDQTNTQCDNPDSCDGAGTCLPRLEPAGAACGSQTDSECDQADTCDGAGTCQTNIQPEGTACGDGSATPCDDPDTCNGLGACLTNTDPNGVPCDDGLFCTVNESCDSGVCTGGSARNCADLLTCTTDVCNDDTDQCDHILDAGRCLIDNVCYLDGGLNSANTCEACDPAQNATDWTVLPDGTQCNDGDACTGTGRPGIGVDTCSSGVCSGVLDPECNDQCEFAVEVVEGATTSDNTSTGPDDGEASCEPDSNADVWFAYTAVCDGAIFLSTTGSELAPSNDPVLNVFDACPGDGGVEIACDDDSGVDLQSALVFSATAGSTYLIRVAGFQSNTGAIVLNLRPVDDCSIDGVCYAEGALNPENECLSCIPGLSTTQWSPTLEGTACGDPADTDCDGPDACDGAGFCELNFKPDGTVCSDEEPANECTQDLCAQGACTHPPEEAGLACGDPSDTECDNPDSCDGGGTCAVNFEDFGFPCGDQTETQCDNPDICDGNNNCLANPKEDGLSCDDANVCTENDVCQTGVCEGVPIPDPPAASGLGARAITVAAQPPGSVAPVAFRVTSPTWPCLSRYVDVDGRLVASPVFRLPSEWGTAIVQDPNIVPSSTYEVLAECGAFQTSVDTAETWLWGDMNNDGIVNVVDVDLAIDAFRGIFTVPFVVVDIHPCEPNDLINVIDITTVVDAFKGFEYPCPSPCL